jgi:hypothetical protein
MTIVIEGRIIIHLCVDGHVDGEKDKRKADKFLALN